MRQWQKTGLLVGFALIGAALAPRLRALSALDAGFSSSDEHERAGHHCLRGVFGEGLEEPGEVSMIVLVDTSGSMIARGKLREARAAMHGLIDGLKPDDSLILLGFSDGAYAIGEGSGTDKQRLHSAVDQIREGGGTNLEDGLERAAAAAQAHPYRAQRLLVLTDGRANLRTVKTGGFIESAAAFAAQGVTVSTIGLGADVDGPTLAAMARAGGGRYYAVTEGAGLSAVFSEEWAHSESAIGQ